MPDNDILEYVSISRLCKEMGRRVIEQAGGIQAYDRIARAKQGPTVPKMALEPIKKITFDG
jgi:hypothetical protein